MPDTEGADRMRVGAKKALDVIQGIASRMKRVQQIEEYTKDPDTGDLV